MYFVLKVIFTMLIIHHPSMLNIFMFFHITVLISSVMLSALFFYFDFPLNLSDMMENSTLVNICLLFLCNTCYLTTSNNFHNALNSSSKTFHHETPTDLFFLSHFHQLLERSQLSVDLG